MPSPRLERDGIEDPSVLSRIQLTQDLSTSHAGLTGRLLFIKRRGALVASARTYSGFKMESQISPDEIRICKRSDGSDWLLGEGNFGQA